MRKYKEKDRVHIYWEKTPFARQLLKDSPKRTGVIREISKGFDEDGNVRFEYIVAEYDVQDKTRAVVLYENEMTLFEGKVSEGDLL